TPENRFATPKRTVFFCGTREAFFPVFGCSAGQTQFLKIKDLAKVFFRVENFHGASSGLLREAPPITQHFSHRLFGFINITDKTKSAVEWKISGCARVFSDHRPP